VTDDVRAALSALATDRVDPAPEVIEEAAAARGDVRAAAAFVAADGTDRLRAAVDRVDDPALARRGRRALADIERCRRAAADHFRSGRGTVLGPDDQRSER
jgi:hypothetical protein